MILVGAKSSNRHDRRWEEEGADIVWRIGTAETKKR